MPFLPIRQPTFTERHRSEFPQRLWQTTEGHGKACRTRSLGYVNAGVPLNLKHKPSEWKHIGQRNGRKRSSRDQGCAPKGSGSSHPQLASDNDDYRGTQVPLSDRELDHMYGFSVTRPSELQICARQLVVCINCPKPTIASENSSSTQSILL